MVYSDNQEWTDKIEYPDKGNMVCPACGKVAGNADQVMGCLHKPDYYNPRHIPKTLIFTCDNPNCPKCDSDYAYELSVVITATAI